MPNKHRFKIKGYEWLKDELLKEEFLNKLHAIKNISDTLNISMAQLSIAWCLTNKNVSTVILGASKKSQLKENLSSLEIYQNLSSDVVSA